MNFYDDPENVKKYIELCEGYDGSSLFTVLGGRLPANSSLLELGSGAGSDIEFLKTRYAVTGSDRSDEFLKICKAKHPELPFLKLDVLDLDLEEEFGCIYSNKVLHHLTETGLIESLAQQEEILSPKGLIAHSFWLGAANVKKHGMLFTYYTEKKLIALLSESFDILTSFKYQELEPDDSIFVIARME